MFAMLVPNRLSQILFPINADILHMTQFVSREIEASKHQRSSNQNISIQMPVISLAY